MADQNLNQSRIDSQKRKEKYKELLEYGGVIGSNAETADVVNTMKHVQEIMTKSDAIHSDGRVRDRLDNTAEVVMDVQVLKMSHELLGTAMQRISGAEFDEDEYANALHNIIGPEMEWDKLFDMVCPIWKVARFSPSMLGTFEAVPIVKENVQKERQQRTKSQPSQQVKPSTVNKLQQEEKHVQVLNVVLEQITRLFHETGSQPIPYYQLIVEPNSFMNTVDNCFQMAFLFRDGHIFMGVDATDNNYPTVRPVSGKNKEQNKNVSNSQFISSINPAMWTKMIHHYNITEPLLNIPRDE